LEVGKVQKIFAQLVGAVTYIHGKNCVHRDLKLENVLLSKDGDVKLVDFGFTREYEGKANYLQTFCGTICYSAPEMLRGEKYAGEKIDVWSLGIILYALLTGQLPFDEDDDQVTKQRILKEEPSYPDTFPAQAKTLVNKLLSKRPLHRPTLADILADPWLVEHAPAQQAILKLSQPAPFTTPLERNTLERMRATGVDIDKVIENVLSQRCDALAGWWALLVEKEARKEARRERKRREKEAELKVLRRLSGASSRLERLASTLEDVVEEGPRTANPRTRSTSRGRTNRRSTPQIMVSDLPQLPEGTAVDSPGAVTPPPPIEKDLPRPKSGSRPPIPPKERRRRSSNLQLVTTNSELLAGTINGVNKRKSGRPGGQKSDRKFLGQLAALKHWFVEATKRTASPASSKKTNDDAEPLSNPASIDGTLTANGDLPQGVRHSREISGTSAETKNSYGATLTPIASNVSSTSNSRTNGPGRLDMQRTRHRQSLSPSPITPRSSFKRPSIGLRGRKSTSSSVSSVRSIPHYTHSRASSMSSGSHDASTMQSPASRSVGRSPHASLKVLPVTPSTATFHAGVRSLQAGNGESLDEFSGTGSSVMFARRKKSPFKGPMLNPSALARNDHLTPNGLGSPALFTNRNREPSAGQLNMGLLDVASRRAAKRAPQQRKSMVITEEEEEEEPDETAIIEDEEEESEIEEVDAFPPVHLRRGESVHSIIFLNDPDLNIDVETPDKSENTTPDLVVEPDQNIIGRLNQYGSKNLLPNERAHASNGHIIKSPGDSLGPSPRHTSTVYDIVTMRDEDVDADVDRTPRKGDVDIGVGVEQGKTNNLSVRNGL